ncbi:MAG: NUDIX domain-containing protein [Bifidobacteriaceae bacterium]|jgi:ADP-ribose pyrophosphatase YjhB (NUDIX family)|nr:NUDIX domain-containing protein [Bifidobacteriaceae bacterium]
MAIPEFIVELREKIGTHELWLTGVTAVVRRGNEVLLVRRADTGVWTPVTGIVDPGEEPADAAAREAMEEAAIRCVPERLAAVRATDLVVYANGDRARYLDHVFACQWVAGEPFPADGENTEARWFDLDQLPPMPDHMVGRIDVAVRMAPGCAFVFAGRQKG